MRLAFYPRLLLAICGSFTVYGTDLTITCPPSFIDGVQYSVPCQVNLTTLNSAETGKCIQIQTVQFQWLQSGNWYSFATSSYSTCNTTFANDARCVNATKVTATYELKFNVDNATQHGRSLRCWSDCIVNMDDSVKSNYTTCNPIRIRGKPPAHHNCPQYVLEGQNLTCKCDGGIDTPPGVFRWADNLGSDSLTLTKALRSQNGSVNRCQAVWNGVIAETEVIYIFNVVYGPDNASATAPDPFDTNGSRDMTLTCSASDVNPSPTFRWTRQGSNDVIHQGQYYTFRPQPPADEGLIFQCQAQNNISNVTRSSAVKVRLNYPPPANPVITNDSSDTNLYQGDTVTFTCTVTGGFPLNATSVTFGCPGKQSTGDIVGITGVSSNVTFRLLDTDNGNTCTCNPTWKQTNNWYNKSAHTTLFVNTPPSTPGIAVASGEYPPVAGEIKEVNLTCVSSNPGRPAAKYTWPINGGGQPGKDLQGRYHLTFRTMSRQNDQLNVTCRASNQYTENKGTVADGVFTLSVYYHPVITLSSHPDVACQLTMSTCEVTEGQKVSILCSAVSNPAPANFTWHRDDVSHNQSSAVSKLEILRADHTIHNGMYNCTVSTGSLGNGRQPLTSSQQLTVLVKYKPTKSRLILNTTNNITVNEKENVDFACLADGRPTANMELKNDAGTVGSPLPGGKVLLEDRDTWLNYTLTALCNHTGVYRCTARNSLGEETSDAMLYVNCKPRAAKRVSQEPPSVIFENQAVQLSLHLVAYPVPQNFSFFYHGPADNKSSNGTVVVDNILSMTCRPTNTLYNVTCTVTVDNITSSDRAGQYSVTVANFLGDEELDFIITVKEPGSTAASTKSWAALGGGIAGAAVVIVVAVVVVFIRRQRQGSDQAGNGSSLREKDRKTRREPEMKVNNIHAGESDKNEDETMIVNNLYGTAEGATAYESQTRTPQHSEYEDVAIPPAAKPHVQPKPQVAANMLTANDGKDTYSVVQKGSKLVSNPADRVEYASVDKSKTATVSGPKNGAASALTRTTVKNKSQGLQKPTKKTNQTKNKFKAKAQKGKKEGADYGNMLLSMNPIDCKVYENLGFQNEELETRPQDPTRQPAEQRSANTDCLVYTTIQFTESQQKKAEHNPPRRETTEYVSIVFNKSPSSTSND